MIAFSSLSKTYKDLLYCWILPGSVHTEWWQVLLKVQMKFCTNGMNPAEGIAFSSK